MGQPVSITPQKENSEAFRLRCFHFFAIWISVYSAPFPKRITPEGFPIYLLPFLRWKLLGAGFDFLREASSASSSTKA